RKYLDTVHRRGIMGALPRTLGQLAGADDVHRVEAIWGEQRVADLPCKLILPGSTPGRSTEEEICRKRRPSRRRSSRHQRFAREWRNAMTSGAGKMSEHS